MIGRKIRVFRPRDKTWYDGQVKSHDKLTGKHLIHFADAEEEDLDLEEEKIEWVEEEVPRKLRRLRRMSSTPELKLESEKESSGEDDDSGDEDWGKEMEKDAPSDDDLEELELEDAEDDAEEAVAAKESRSRRGKSSLSAGSGKRKKVDVEKLGCSKKFKFKQDVEGLKDGPSVNLLTKSGSTIGFTLESK